MASAKHSWSTNRPILERAMNAQEDLDQLAVNLISNGNKRSSMRVDSSGPNKRTHSPREFLQLKNTSVKKRILE